MRQNRFKCNSLLYLNRGLPGSAVYDLSAGRQHALDRFRLLQPHLEDNRPLRLVAVAAGIPFRTAQRWVALYHQFGLAALARKKRTDSGDHRAVSVKIREAIEGLALQKPPLPTTAICRQVRRLAQGLGEEPPSYWVVYRIVSGLPADLVTLAHQGTKAYSLMQGPLETCPPSSAIRRMECGLPHENY